MSEPVTHQVQGFCEGVMERGDWAEFHINVGRQYPVKLASKKEDVKVMARMAGQSPAVWTYNETQGNPNPHRPGEFFKNRYLENVEVGGTLDPNLAQPQAATTNTQATTPSGGARGTATDRSIERQVIIKSAIHLYPTTLVETDEQWFDFINRLDDFMLKPAPAAAAPAPAAVAAPAATEPPEDDIPF